MKSRYPRQAYEKKINFTTCSSPHEIIYQPNKRKVNHSKTCETDSDTGSLLQSARDQTNARCLNLKKKRKSRKESRKRRTVLTSQEFNEDLDETELERIDNPKFRKKLRLSRVGHSTNNYRDYELEDEDYFTFHSTPNIDPSTIRRRYIVYSDEDTEVDESPFERIDSIDIALAEDSFTREKGGSDTASSAHLRSNKMSGESVNDTIIACQNEESSDNASSARAKTMSVQKTAEIGSDDSGVKVTVERIVINNSSDDEPKESDKQKVPSSNKNKDEINTAPEENEENNTILADKEPSGEELQAISDGGREGSLLKHVSNEQREEETEPDKSVMVPSRKKQNGEQSRKRNKLSKKSKVRADGSPKERRIRKKSSTAPCSDQSQLAKNSSEAEEMNMLQSTNQSWSDLWMHTTAGSPALEEEPIATDDKDCYNGVRKENNTILADKEPSGEEIQAISNGGREESSLKHVSNEQREEETEPDKSVMVPSRKKQNGEQSRKRNKLSEKSKVRADGAPEERRIIKKSSTAPCSDQSQLAKNSSEAEEMNMLQSTNQSRSDLWMHTTAGSPALEEEPIATDDIDCDNGVRKETAEGIVENGEMPKAGAIEKPVKKKLSSLRPSELFQALADSVLGRGPTIDSESEDEPRHALTTTSLPIKFRFDDEIPTEEVEKTEFEVELEGCFDESFSMMWQDSSKLPEVNSELAEETQEARCARGLHEYKLEDENGMYCIHCPHVELGPEDILPPWAAKTRKRGRKRLAYGDELPEFIDERRVVPSSHVEPSEENTAALSCPDDGTVWDVIPCVRKMYQHQQEGFEFLWKNLAGGTNIAELKNMAIPKEVGGCIISHAPGTGKTRLTIVFLETYLKVFPDSRPVIIAPASMLLTWEEELQKWAFPFPVHNLNNPEFTGYERKNALKCFPGTKCNDKDMVRMVKLFSWDKGGSVLVISYSLFGKLNGEKQVEGNNNKESNVETMKEILLDKPGLVILDEGHTARNETSNIWNALLKLKTDKRVILSGTPFQNNFSELFNSLKLVRPAVAKDKTFFKINKSKKWKPNQSGPISETIDGAELEKLKSVMLPFVNIHKGTILREKLIGLGDSVILLKPPDLQKSLIDTLERQRSFEIEHKVALISVHPYLYMHCGSSKKQNFDIDMNLVEASRLNPNEGAKTKFIIELLRFSMAAKEKVLIFSQFIQPLELIKDQLKEVFQWVEGKEILQLEGKVDQKHRQNMIKIYNDPLSEARVMLASIKCCSEGISLVGASRIVLLDVVWNPSVERQAICRAYRIGQTKFVHTYHLMTSGTTEGDKYCRQVEKERLSDLVFCSSSAENDEEKKHAAASSIKKDVLLEQIVDSATMSDMFEKIIYHPKDTDLFQNFALTY